MNQDLASISLHHGLPTMISKILKFLHRKSTRIILLILSSLIVAVCLAGVLLLNLPFFYEKSSQHMLLSYAMTASAFLIVILLVNKVFITPFVKLYLQQKNWIFIIIMILILTIALSLGSVYYWNIPIRHTVEICFDADDPEENLSIQRLMDPNNNRLHSSSNFGVEDYPIIVETGICIDGNIIDLDPLKVWLSKRLKSIVQENPPDGRFFVSINNVPSVVYFDRNAEDNSNVVTINEGFENGTILPFAEHKLIYSGIKALAVFCSAIYLSLFFFGLTELMFKNPRVNENIQTDENDENH